MFGGMNGRAAFGAAGYRAVKTVLKRELRRSCNYGGGEAEGVLHGLAAVVSAGDKVHPYGVPLITPPPRNPRFSRRIHKKSYPRNPSGRICRFVKTFAECAVIRILPW